MKKGFPEKESLFQWIVTDFHVNDCSLSGLCTQYSVRSLREQTVRRVRCPNKLQCLFSRKTVTILSFSSPLYFDLDIYDPPKAEFGFFPCLL